MISNDVSAEITVAADEIFEQRKRISPAFAYLVAHNIADENKDFFEWDKALWDLHDFLLRSRARLESEDYDRQAVLTEARAAKGRLPDLLGRLDEFSSRAWWLQVEFPSASN